MLIPGCGNEESAPLDLRCTNIDSGLGLDLDVEVRKAFYAQPELLDDPFCCSVADELGDIVAVGDQIRVIRSDSDSALYTVAEHRAADDLEVVRMALDGRKRVGTSNTFDGIVAPAANPYVSEEEAEETGDFIERIDDDGECTGLAVIAPHGGMIERRTCTQAEYVRAAISNSSSWRLKGWSPGGGAYDRWHITATKLSPNSFPGLAQITGRGFAYCVAFHGMSSAGVLVGGGAPYSLRKQVRDAIADAIDDDVGPIVVAGDDEPLNGDSPNNVVNWLTAGGAGGVQLEQSMKVRVEHWEAVAEAVASVFAELV